MSRIDNKLIADEGMTLANGETFGKIVWLGVGDDGSSWTEITDAEAEIMKRDLEAANELEQKAAAYDILMGLDSND